MQVSPSYSFFSLIKVLMNKNSYQKKKKDSAMEQKEEKQIAESSCIFVEEHQKHEL